MADQEHVKTRTTYDANCHCGMIRYTVTLNDALAPVGKGVIGHCNCSICTKNGYLLVYPRREDVVFRDSCDEKLADYFFGLKRKPHRFCPQCGSSVLIDFKNSNIEQQRPFLAVNSRLIRDIDLDHAVYSKFDGRKLLEPAYEPPLPQQDLSEAKSTSTSQTIYHASCHCGSVKYTVALDGQLSPEGDTKLSQCNCSICLKTGYRMVYPKPGDVILDSGSEAKIKSYFFGQKRWPHHFCGDCGSSLGKVFSVEGAPVLATNARMFSNLDFEKADYTLFDGKNKEDPPYEI